MFYEVTLAMPVYNVEKNIEKSFLSALDQTFDSIEFLIIDDKGNDNSINIINKIISKHPRGKHVRIIDHKINKGTGATKNTAIQEAQGKYLYFMDSDDTITNNCIEILYNKIKETPVDFVAASYKHYDLNGHELNQTILTPKVEKGKYSLAKYVFSTKEFYVQTWNKLFNLDFLRDNQIQCIPNHLNEDIWFTFQLANKTSSFIFTDEITYNYFIYENSTMHNLSKGYSERMVKQFTEILELEKNYVLTNPEAIKCPDILNEIIWRMIIHTPSMIQAHIDLKIKKECLSTWFNFKSLQPYINKNELIKNKYKRLLLLLNLIDNLHWKIFIFKVYFRLTSLI